ncbi:MAG TPA: 4-hydroxy-tetrahydrodipicolinate synthase [Planctomycetota bacterium]|nr:4-hydroxy-tetrahydrodipicolinate synthase [Planctomycetota bacterium]
MTESFLQGSFVALVTPMKGGKVDERALADLVEWHVKSGTKGLVPCGTTGESPTLSHEEHRAVVDLVVEKSKGRVPVVAGTGSNSTEEAVSLTKHAARSGAKGVLVITPYYNKPTQDGLYAHFAKVAEAAGDLPVVLYNVPGRTSVDLLPPTVEKLCRNVPNIVAVKEATGSVDRTSELLERVPDLIVLSGDDSLNLPIMAVGGAGTISVVANVLPAETQALCAAASKGDLAEARRIHKKLYPIARALFVETNPIPVKYALARIGRIGPEIRLPLTPLSASGREKLDPVLDALGLKAQGAKAAVG